MKLYNIYRLCKCNLNFFENLKDEHTNDVYTIKNWLNVKEKVENISKVSALNKYACDFINTIPDTVRHKDNFRIEKKLYDILISKMNLLHSKMATIVELYESMGLNEEDNTNAIDIKMPPCEDLNEYISCLKDINFVFTQCPFLQCEGEVLKFSSVDVGSNWLRLTIATTTACMLLGNIASVLDKAIALRSHYITIQQQEELLKSMQTKNELAEEQVKTFKQLKNAGVEIVIKKLEKEQEKTLDPEERDKTERSLDKLILFLDKGGEIYASLDAPEEIQLLFPEIEGNYELPENIIKYLEDKENSQEEN